VARSPGAPEAAGGAAQRQDGRRERLADLTLRVAGPATPVAGTAIRIRGMATRAAARAALDAGPGATVGDPGAHGHRPGARIAALDPRTGAGPTARRAGLLPRRAAGLVALLLALTGSVNAAAAAPRCDGPAGFPVQQRLESPDTVVLYRTVPAPIPIGQHFALEAVVCTAPSAGAASGLVVDAFMPEHRHGMNYRPRVSRRPDGVYVAEGLLFHMPGQWQIRFDVQRGSQSERLSTDIELE
jgi:hypothetical protein